ncbi:hypothetical protein [Pseudoduganella chitinolytica]|uniref:EF-hand domain-containing protein n=1 Tax=Pseudoduganella chitinolytica TaxID=34070 RepID=A0ABY8BGW9_9BURK|nr:hypothetical protein [Pseudoduganella chitinolytica]WEF35080.1 hypothetical protein PX653_10055 [Pseudoduganella chitinolytica]
MKKTIARIAAMMAFATASAAPVSYEFEWKGFDAFTSTATGETTGGWNPLASIRGYFQGEDRNGDNTIRGEELDRFGFYDQTTGERLELIGCPGTGAGASGLTGCNVGWFSYSQEGGLMLSGND